MHVSGHNTLLFHWLPGCLWPPARLLISWHLLQILSVGLSRQYHICPVPAASFFVVFMVSSLPILYDLAWYLSLPCFWLQSALLVFAYLVFTLHLLLPKFAILGTHLVLFFPTVFLLAARMGGVWSVRSPRASPMLTLASSPLDSTQKANWACHIL
jgi:hypothetical protein